MHAFIDSNFVYELYIPSFLCFLVINILCWGTTGNNVLSLKTVVLLCVHLKPCIIHCAGSGRDIRPARVAAAPAPARIGPLRGAATWPPRPELVADDVGCPGAGRSGVAASSGQDGPRPGPDPDPGWELDSDPAEDHTADDFPDGSDSSDGSSDCSGGSSSSSSSISRGDGPAEQWITTA